MKKLIIVIFFLMGFMGFSPAKEKPLSKTLTIKQQKLIIISALTAKGDLIPLKKQLAAGLQAGLTVNEIKEALVHLYAYCGFPRSIRGLQTFIVVLDERKKQGIKENQGKQATPIHDDRSKFERGKSVLETLTGASQDGAKAGYAAFSPEIEIFLKEHLFADIFERDILSFADRELITVSVLSSIGGVEPMLNSHFGICLNLGITPEQLRQFITIIGNEIGRKDAEKANVVLTAIVNSKKQIPN